MGLAESLFHQLIEKTEDLIKILKPTLKVEANKDVDHLFEERELLLKQLRDILQKTANRDHYQPLYESWQVKETELQEFLKTSLKELEMKITETQNARTISKQYDSYFRQMPYGAFLDKKS